MTQNAPVDVEPERTDASTMSSSPTVGEIVPSNSEADSGSDILSAAVMTPEAIDMEPLISKVSDTLAAEVQKK